MHQATRQGERRAVSCGGVQLLYCIIYVYLLLHFSIYKIEAFPIFTSIHINASVKETLETLKKICTVYLYSISNLWKPSLHPDSSAYQASERLPNTKKHRALYNAPMNKLTHKKITTVYYNNLI